MSQQSSISHEAGVEALKAFPPLTVLALTLNEWLAAISIIYVAVQLAYLVCKWIRERKAKAT